MKIFRNVFEAGKALPRSVVAIGKFDGIHRGHRKLIETAVKKARALKAPCMVLTFDPSPEQFFGRRPEEPILPLAARLERLKTLDVDGVALVPFDESLACVSPEAFATHILAGQLKPAGVCVGQDFCFGKDRAGRVETLRALGPGLGFWVRSVPLVRAGGEKVSSSRIRELLRKGERRRAESLLGFRLPG